MQPVGLKSGPQLPTSTYLPNTTYVFVSICNYIQQPTYLLTYPPNTTYASAGICNYFHLTNLPTNLGVYVPKNDSFLIKSVTSVWKEENVWPTHQLTDLWKPSFSIYLSRSIESCDLIGQSVR